MIMIGDGKGEVNGTDGKRKVYVYVRSIRSDGMLCGMSWLDHERIRIMIHHQSLHIECTYSKDPRADLIIAMQLTGYTYLFSSICFA